MGEEDAAAAAEANFAPVQHQAATGGTDPFKHPVVDEDPLSAASETALEINTKPKRGRPRKQPEPTTPEEQTTLAKEILDNLARFPNCLLLTRVGQFYESYFSQAAEIASLLKIKLTTRKWGGKRVPMCGFPLAHLDKYLRMLVGENRRLVAMCEEFPVSHSTDAGPPREGKISRGLPTRAFERRVTRVITPGTLIDEPFLNQYENNYLLAISEEEAQHAATIKSDEGVAEPARLGLAWIDVSTGEFFSKVSSIDTIRDELARIGPKEVVLDKRMKRQQEADDDAQEDKHPILAALAEEQYFVSYQTPEGDDNATANISAKDDAATRLTEPDDLLAEAAPSPSPSSFTPTETSAISLLTAYLRAHLREHMPDLGVPVRESDALEGEVTRTGATRVSLRPPARMHLDAHTLRALEIREGMREGGTRGSLLSVVRRTKTTGGTRLLARWLAAPSLSLAEITSRHSLVAFLLARPHLRADLSALLVSIPDVGRLSQKLMLGKGDASDVRAVGRAIRSWHRLRNTITAERAFEGYERQMKDPKAPTAISVNDEEWESMDTLLSRMDGLDDLEQRIASALEGGEAEEGVEMGVEADGDGGAAGELQGGAAGVEEDPNRRLNWRPHAPQRWMVKPEFSAALTQLHDTLRELLRRREKMEAELLMRYSAPSLTLRSSPALGMHVHIARRKRDCRLLDANPEFVKVAESGSTKGYFWRPWTQLGSEIVETTLALQVAEREAFDILRREINAHAPALRRNARVLDELDVTLGFAALAADHGYVRPVMTNDTTYHVTNGRHPTVEMGLLSVGRTFTPNTTCCPTSTAHLHILTGPNMAGKSTVLRQTALIAIMAQAGSFVPATAAHLGLVDAVFARVGARDDLARDRSTFMVEMLETGAVLRRATSRSLVIMDEIGRGTAFRDGLAIAFATVVHLLRVNRCRALFATHFTEVADLVGWEAEHPTEASSVDADHDCDRKANRGEANPFKDVAFFCTDVYDADSSHIAYAYRLRRGVNRRSHALRVAALAGVPQAALSVAQDTLEWLDSQNDRVLPPDQLRELGRRIVQQVDIAGS
ncbi:muts domain V-domain-containing protein [Schizophyllum commune]